MVKNQRWRFSVFKKIAQRCSGCARKYFISHRMNDDDANSTNIILIISFKRVTYQVGAPVPITGIKFGMRMEFGYDCLIPADFEVDVSIMRKNIVEWIRIYLLTQHR